MKDFVELKKKFIEAPILIALDWPLPLELMCGASDMVVEVFLGQDKYNIVCSIKYVIKTLDAA